MSMFGSQEQAADARTDKGPETLSAFAAGAQLVHERMPSIDEARVEWQELAPRSGNVFSTWEWAETWWRHFGGSRQLRLTACRTSEGALVAILPLYSWRRRPLHVLRFVGHGPGDQLGPVAAVGDRPQARHALSAELDASGWHLFLGDHLPGDEDWQQALGGTTLSRTGAPVIRFGGRTWDDVLASRSANFRQQVRRRERTLAKAHELRFRLTTDPAKLSDDLDVLFSLHAERWGDESSFAGAARSFHQDFAGQAFDNGWLRLWIADLDGSPAAAWYGFRFAGSESYYQAGWRSEWAHSSVATVLLVHTIREACADGMLEYRFLQGDEPYKYRFTDDDPGLVTIASARGPLARAALLAGSQARRFAPSRAALGGLLDPS
jgi:CelD/BcsL family acetyltransferase involved in cellulose biosynthesis